MDVQNRRDMSRTVEDRG